MANTYFDYLTTLNNMEFLNGNYSNYIETYENASIIAIDFTRFKYINDNYGHKAGDVCLRAFGAIVKHFFKNSLLIRRSGDEFIIVTAYTKEEIKKAMDNCYKEIAAYYENKLIPTKFAFNCGVVDAEKDLTIALDKADVTMYEAKVQNERITYFNKESYQNAKLRENFVNNVKYAIENDDIFFAEQHIHGGNIDIKELYSRDKDGKSLFSGINYDLLNSSYTLKNLDLLNFKKVLSLSKAESGVLLLNVNSQTLHLREFDFINYATNEVIKSGANPDKIILGINRNGSTISTTELAKMISELKAIGFRICLDNYKNSDDPLGISVWSNTPIIDYIKIDKNFWAEGLNREDPKYSSILRAIIPTLISFDTLPIFTRIETQNEHEYIKSFGPKVLGKGYHYDNEKKS